MAKGNFGECLKRERDLREVSLDELSKSTRISVRFLEALENEDWERLPGGIFGHGFVRAIARYLGLDEEALLSEYDLARADKLPPPPVKTEERIPSPPKWTPLVLALAALLLLIGLLFAGRYAWRRLVTHRASKNAAAPQSQSDEAAAASVAGSGEFSAVLLELNSRTPGALGAQAPPVQWSVGHDDLR